MSKAAKAEEPHPINSVFLTGWEYNRLLQKDPTKPRNSALPAATFWAGAHQLWLFENVYCTREAYENEVEATNQMGWFTGKALNDLFDKDALTISDWQKLPAPVDQRIREAHKEAKRRYPPRVVRRAIRSGDASTLEAAKAELLKPVLDYHSAVQSGAPNSINNWISLPRQQRPLWQYHLMNLAAPVLAGIQVCRPPGIVASQAERETGGSTTRCRGAICRGPIGWRWRV